MMLIVYYNLTSSVTGMTMVWWIEIVMIRHDNMEFVVK
jgi:hypothetical protein